MIRKILAILLFFIMLAVSFYIKSQIDAFNIDYYHSKDNGAFVQFESIIIFSFLFFILISTEKRIMYGIAGIIIGIISSIICYLLFFTEVTFPITASLIVMLSFYLIKYLSKLKNKNKASR